MADLPDEDHEFFRQFVGVIDREESDKEIEDKIRYFLEHEKEREALAEKGYELTSTLYTQEKYAEKFLTAVSEYLQMHNGKKITN